MTPLKKLLLAMQIPQADIAAELGISRAAMSQIVNHNIFPVREGKRIRDAIPAILKCRGATAPMLKDLFQKNSGIRPNASRPSTEPKKEDSMLLRKQTLYPQTRKHFGLFRDPFTNEVNASADVFLSPDIRYVREALYQTAVHGGMMAVSGESGAGKTLLLRDLEDRIAADNQPITIIRPYVLAMEDNDTRGKTLKAADIANAIMTAVAPLEKIRRDSNARFAQLHRALKDSHAAGYRHCLVIDEAHSLPVPTLKHLKRFFELEIGFKKLLSIILLGQPELRIKLSERDQAVREVVQRCEMVELPPLDTHLAAYLKHKFDRAGKPVGEVIDDPGIEALRARLTLVTRRGDGPRAISLTYPLAVANLLTAAMNLAAELGAPIVNADIIKGV